MSVVVISVSEVKIKSGKPEFLYVCPVYVCTFGKKSPFGPVTHALAKKVTICAVIFWFCVRDELAKGRHLINDV